MEEDRTCVRSRKCVCSPVPPVRVHVQNGMGSLRAAAAPGRGRGESRRRYSDACRFSPILLVAVTPAFRIRRVLHGIAPTDWVRHGSGILAGLVDNLARRRALRDLPHHVPGGEPRHFG